MSAHIRFIPSAESWPRVYVYHERGAPEPLEALDYTPHKEIELPAGIEAKSIPDQLRIAEHTIRKWRNRITTHPFGQVIGYEFQCTVDASIFLNEHGEFAGEREPNHEPADLAGQPQDQLANQCRRRTYVVGYRTDGFCSLVCEVEGESADDRDLFYARRFSSLLDAQAAADQHAVSVFEVVGEEGQETLREITVDLGRAHAMPFANCYLVAERLFAGPSFLAGSHTDTQERLTSLATAGVTCIISVVEASQLAATRQALELFASRRLAEGQLQQNFFHVPDGEAPSKNQMGIILDVIDAGYLEGRVIYLHCWGGRGRTGAVAGCWMRRHGIARGAQALDEIAELRFACGVFSESPETESQRRLVRQWEEGE